MSAKNDLTIPLLPGKYYHIYNRGNNKGNIFFNEENYRYFLDKYNQKLSGYFDTIGYCLLSNHFHLLIRVKSPDEIFANAIKDFTHINESFYKDYTIPWVNRIGQKLAKQDLTNFKNLLDLSISYGDTRPEPPDFPLDLDEVNFRTQLASWVVSERFRGFMLGYTKAINKQQVRTGSLFQKGFRRKYITEDIVHLKTVLMYIHHNPIHHFYTENYDDYIWSSYNAYLTGTIPLIRTDVTLALFGGRIEFETDAATYKNFKRTNYEWMIDE
jgi:putative transposase